MNSLEPISLDLKTKGHLQAWYDRVLTRLSATKSVYLFLILAIMPTLLTCLLHFLERFSKYAHIPKQESLSTNSGMSWGLRMTLIAIVAPLAETFFFQFLPAWLQSNALQKISKFWVAFAASCAFAYMHPHAVAYLVGALIMGFMFCTVYFAKSQRKSRAFFIVAFAHSIGNVLAITVFPF